MGGTGMRQGTFLLQFCALFWIFVVSFVEVCGQSDSLILGAEQNWDTGGFGGTCIYGGHNFASARAAIWQFCGKCNK
jgi:hypothetical protein